MKDFKSISLVVFFTIVSSFIFAQSSQVREAKDFSEIDVSEGIYVELTLGKEAHVEVFADEDIIDKVVTEIKDGELDIFMKGNNFKLKNKQVVVKVTANTISKIKTSSGSSLISQNLIESTDLSLKASSGSTLKVSFKSPRSSCEASSGSSAHLKGVTKYFRAQASSGSSLHAERLTAINVDAAASSGASLSVNCEEEFKADASSGGSINYSGNPKLVDIEKSSGGSVSKR